MGTQFSRAGCESVVVEMSTKAVYHQGTMLFEEPVIDPEEAVEDSPIFREKLKFAESQVEKVAS